jgi:hypothetical protein
MRVGAPSTVAAYAWAVQLSQMTSRIAAHQSTATDRPVDPPGALTGDTLVRRPSRHTFDTRV